MLAGFSVLYTLIAVVTALSIILPQTVIVDQPFNVDWSLDFNKLGFSLFLADDTNQSLHPQALTTINPQATEGTIQISLSSSDISTIPGRYRILAFDSSFQGTPQYGSPNIGSSSNFPIVAPSQNGNSRSSPSTSTGSTTGTNTITNGSLRSGLTSSVGTSDILSHTQGEASSPSSQASDTEANFLTTTQSSGTATTFSSTSTTEPVIGSPSSNVSKSRIPTIVGTILGALIALVLITLFFLIRRIRQRRNRDTVKDCSLTPTMTVANRWHATREISAAAKKTLSYHIVPETTSPQEQLEVHTRTNQLERVPSITKSQHSSDSHYTLVPTGRQMHLQQISETLRAHIGNLEAEIQTSNTQAMADIERLRRENEWLREQLNSDWALGLTDEPLPSYSSRPPSE